MSKLRFWRHKGDDIPETADKGVTNESVEDHVIKVEQNVTSKVDITARTTSIISLAMSVASLLLNVIPKIISLIGGDNDAEAIIRSFASLL